MNLRRSAVPMICVLVLVAGIGCKKDTSSNPVTSSAGGSTIGASGGTITSSDNAITLVFPAGALSTDTTITVTAIADTTCPSHIGVTYDFEPNGQVFNAPVTLVMHYKDSDLVGSSPSYIGVGYKDASGWHSLTGGSVDTAAHTITVPIQHFSEYSQYEAFTLDAGDRKGWVFVSDPSANVFTVEMAGEPVTNPGHAPATMQPTSSVYATWAVEGTPNGNASVGTLQTYSTSPAATYRSPARMPASNPVHITATVTTQSLAQVTLLTTQWVVAKKWEIDDDRKFGVVCQSNGASFYHYDYDSPSQATFELDFHGNVTNVDPLTLLSTITNSGPCQDYPGVSWIIDVKQGKPNFIKDVNGEFTIAQGLMLGVTYHELDQPGVTVTEVVGGQSVQVLQQPVLPGHDDANEQVRFPLKDMTTDDYSSKSLGLPEYVETHWVFKAVY